MFRASDIIQHGGVVLGPWHGAIHAFEDRMLGDPGYGEQLCIRLGARGDHRALLLTRRRLFEELGGFDITRFAVNFNDVDYCLRLRQAGYRIVFSPHARIRHFESVSRGREKGSPAGLRLHRELACLRAIWRENGVERSAISPPVRARCSALPCAVLGASRSRTSPRPMLESRLPAPLGLIFSPSPHWPANVLTPHTLQSGIRSPTLCLTCCLIPRRSRVGRRSEWMSMPAAETRHSGRSDGSAASHSRRCRQLDLLFACDRTLLRS